MWGGVEYEIQYQGCDDFYVIGGGGGGGRGGVGGVAGGGQLEVLE